MLPLARFRFTFLMRGPRRRPDYPGSQLRGQISAARKRIIAAEDLSSLKKVLLDWMRA